MRCYATFADFPVVVNSLGLACVPSIGGTQAYGQAIAPVALSRLLVERLVCHQLGGQKASLYLGLIVLQQRGCKRLDSQLSAPGACVW